MEKFHDESGRVDVRSLSLAGIQELVAGMGKERFRALQVWKWIWQRKIADFSEMTNISKGFRGAMAERAYLLWLELARMERSEDGTRKLAWRLEDGRVVESVLIADEERLTLCVSSQVGCAMGCAFCLTADMGLVRNLKPAEIALQVAQAEGLLDEGERISNIVFMGMGEPLANLENVLIAIEILLDENALNYSHRKITVSTSGLVPKLRELADRSPVNLAISLNGTTDEQRTALMPVNKAYPLAALLETCRTIPLPAGKRITFEYVMIAGFNDSLEDARRLLKLMRPLKAKINLLPYNENPERDLERPSEEVVKAFQNHIIQGGIQCSVRTSRGRDISAACGQLGKGL
ncbi:MAG: 23S rRNA (adenine(2503)-C(2))-methyltransferase RlmN [Pseudomonadota bacterium]